ncbi:crossover junction endodeoxyribonuclease RuvC [bacterium]|nr:crossover junction endodeoxyribonuclease RuvC [bacterium]
MAKGKQSEKIILGIDPGTNISGYGVISVSGNELKLLSMGIFDLRKDANQALKLKSIFKQCTAVIEQYLPDELAIEAPFFGKNPQSMLKLGRAQGVAIAAALNRGVPIFEYAPKRVKQSVTGNGNASKEQVAGMIKSLLRLEILPSNFDATDAVAIAICHHFMYKPGQETTGKHYNSWNSFISNNPDKIR